MYIEFKAKLWIDCDLSDENKFINEELQTLLQECMDTACISIDNVEILSQEE